MHIYLKILAEFYNVMLYMYIYIILARISMLTGECMVLYAGPSLVFSFIIR